VWDLGLRVWGLGFGVEGLGFGVYARDPGLFPHLAALGVRFGVMDLVATWEIDRGRERGRESESESARARERERESTFWREQGVGCPATESCLQKEQDLLDGVAHAWCLPPSEVNQIQHFS